MSYPKSTAQVAGHPIHPMLVPFPIAFFVSTLACDLAFVFTGDALWILATKWLLGGALVIGALAAVMGVVDLAGEQKIRELKSAWLHGAGNSVAMLLGVSNLYLRLSEEANAVVPIGLTLSFVVVIILVYTGWKGWDLVYRHHVGSADHASVAGRDAEAR